MKNTTIAFAAGAASLMFIGSAAAATISVSNSAPTVDGADIAMLITTGSFDIGGNEGHIWTNRPAQGQTFLTGSNAAGYTLNAVTLQSRQSNNHSGTFPVRLGTISGTSFTEVSSEAFDKVAYSGNDYLTATFTTPITLTANTLYGFDWGSAVDGGFITNNNVDTGYTGGSAYSSGTGTGLGDATITLRNADRVFHVGLTAITVAVPEPSTTALLGLGGLALAFRRRK